jgi:hypothetical protein
MTARRLIAPALLAALIFAELFCARPAHAEGFLRSYVQGAPAAANQKVGATPTESTTVPVTSSLWFSPSIGFDVFQVDLKTRQYVTGIVPGIGYGLKYCPAGWTATSAVLAVDLFVQAALVDNTATTPGAKFFSIEALPILTILDWVSLGFGVDEYVGVSSLPSELHWVFSFGLKKST